MFGHKRLRLLNTVGGGVDTIEIQELYFLPPLALARVGPGETPLDCFHWATNPLLEGGNHSIIEPAVTMLVEADGSVSPYMPATIRFRDVGGLRPVAPFFELWVRTREVVGSQDRITDQALSLDLLARLGSSLQGLRYRITVGNKKAERRTLWPAAGFFASVTVRGDDHARKSLLACSPFNSGETPLVDPARPIPLGTFQVIKPVPGFSHGVDLSAIRMRFTPAKGEVYGPANVTVGVAKTLVEGVVMPPQVIEGRMYEIVPEKNCILNVGTPWQSYLRDQPGQCDPQPSDSFDGAANGNLQSFGIVDDTCDGLLEAWLVANGLRYRATARVIVGPPDYAPDRRPFVSLADDLADRDLLPVTVDAHTLEETEDEIVDLFQRVFNTAGAINLDQERVRGLGGQPSTDFPNLPKTDCRSMTKNDKPFVDYIPDLLGEPTARAPLPYAAVATTVHGMLTDADTLLDVLRTKAKHIKQLIRPPFGRFQELDQEPGATPKQTFRDPRVFRDTLHDMRMPPYFRDCDENPLSLTWRQYQTLMKLIDLLNLADPRVKSRLARHVASVVARINGTAPTS
jgi:hypothetical protein